MTKRIWTWLMVGALAGNPLWAASDSFIGKWKLDLSKSVLTDQMKVDSVNANTYAFDFGSTAETIVADGTDQPGILGTTLAVVAEKPDTWKVIRKKDGKLMLLGIWTLSADGNHLHDNFTSYRADGTTSTVDYLYKRTAGQSGFAGTWESVSEKMSSVFELEIRSYEGDGLSFISQAMGGTKDLKFDGTDTPTRGPNVFPGSASSIRRVDDRNLEMTDKIDGKIRDTEQINLSADGKILTMSVLPVGRNPSKVYVFDRE